MEIKMLIAPYKGQGNGGVKVIKVEGEREKEKEVIVRYEVFCFLTGRPHAALNPMFVKMGTTIPSSPLQAAGFSNGVN